MIRTAWLRERRMENSCDVPGRREAGSLSASGAAPLQGRSFVNRDTAWPIGVAANGLDKILDGAPCASVPRAVPPRRPARPPQADRQGGRRGRAVSLFGGGGGDRRTGRRQRRAYYRRGISTVGGFHPSTPAPVFHQATGPAVGNQLRRRVGAAMDRRRALPARAPPPPRRRARGCARCAGAARRRRSASLSAWRRSPSASRCRWACSPGSSPPGCHRPITAPWCPG